MRLSYGHLNIPMIYMLDAIQKKKSADLYVSVMIAKRRQEDFRHIVYQAKAEGIR